ncbi:VOC family protein [Phenylobacterium sp.]|uniref:VOC family protein n=1 Tax=Phenylobacterium sp. TaxID=1871053 RepID=UPI003D27A62B
MQLNHLHLHVVSVDEAAAFYTGHFGFRPHVRQDDGTLFLRDAGGLDLALAAGPPDNFPPWAHFGFRLDNADAVRSLYARLQAADVTIRHPLDEEPDFVWFRCADPDGHLIEVYWEP